MTNSVSAVARVLRRVEMIPMSGCWIFMGATNEFGYGIVGKGGRGQGTDRAHRITYTHFVGPIPDGMFVCHRCDVPSCCNPNHLFIGTNQDNVRDCWNKGRASRPPENDHVVGMVHPGSKLTDDEVLEIRALYSTGMTQKDLGIRYGVHQTTILQIVKRRRWKHL